MIDRIATQRTTAQTFRDMHRPGRTLLLPNAWDVMSARIFEEAGFGAIGTTSGGIAYARGYPDGESMPRDEMIAEVARIAAAIAVPVTADIEAGYGPDAADVAETVRAVIHAGAVGINLEDGTGDPEAPLFATSVQAKRIAASRHEADRMGIPLVVNARVDTFLTAAGPPKDRLQETVARASAYVAAGADCIFVPIVVDPPTVTSLVQAITAPLNLMAMPGAPSAPELFALGATRVSIGASATLAVMGLIRDIAAELRDAGTYDLIARTNYGFPQAQALFAPRRPASSF